MIKYGMLKTRMKRVADRGDHTVRRLAEIEASIADLSNEDLLDLADIFKAEVITDLKGKTAAAATPSPA